MVIDSKKLKADVNTFCTHNGITQAQLVGIIGISYNTLLNAFSGASISETSLNKIATAILKDPKDYVPIESDETSISDVIDIRRDIKRNTEVLVGIQDTLDDLSNVLDHIDDRANTACTLLAQIITRLDGDDGIKNSLRAIAKELVTEKGEQA